MGVVCVHLQTLFRFCSSNLKPRGRRGDQAREREEVRIPRDIYVPKIIHIHILDRIGDDQIIFVQKSCHFT